MKKYFNIAGPCIEEKHYMLPSQDRCRDLRELVDREQYFVIHAARQTGKTTLIRDFVKNLNASDEFYGLYCSLEELQGAKEIFEALPRIGLAIANELRFHPLLKNQYSDFLRIVKNEHYGSVLRIALTELCAGLDRPLVIMFDEADCLSNGPLVAFLRQLRYGYINRSTQPFVHSLALTGMRNIRDYKGKIREDRETLGSASPFNIVKTSVRLRDFTVKEIGRLYGQHTRETGQRFEKSSIDAVFRHTHGQPWLVNAIACEIVEQILKSEETTAITPDHVSQAVETIILRRDTHIDSLIERLKEERVRRIVEPVILGGGLDINFLSDDCQYVLDMGLMDFDEGDLKPANPIYAEVILRTLTYNSQYHLERSLERKYIVGDRLDMTSLLKDFQQFWRENSDIWVEKYQYREAAPHLILMAYLQRVINAGGTIAREYAASRGRIDLCIHMGDNRYPLELKLYSGDKTYREGKEQLRSYMDSLGCVEGWLVVFDRRPDRSWDEKIFWKIDEREGKTLHTVGC